MAGSKAGGQKAKATMKERYGEDFFKRIGALGGKKEVPKGFAINRALASEVGRRGGQISRRKKKDTTTE